MVGQIRALATLKAGQRRQASNGEAGSGRGLPNKTPKPDRRGILADPLSSFRFLSERRRDGYQKECRTEKRSPRKDCLECLPASYTIAPQRPPKAWATRNIFSCWLENFGVSGVFHGVRTSGFLGFWRPSKSEPSLIQIRRDS